MSYSNPRWYGVGDTTSFSKSFEKTFNTQFKSAYDYYDAKSKELEEYNSNLEVEAEKQRKELLKGKEVTPKVLAKVESAVQDFLKQGRQITKDTDLFGAPDLVKKSKAEIDKASASFTGRIGVANEFLENALTGKLIPKRDLDRGSATYLKYNKVLNAIKENPDSFDFKYTGDNEYDFSVQYKDEDGSVKSVSADELKAMIELNDPETRKLIDKNFKDTSVQMYGLTKTAFSERIARGEYKKDPRTGSIYVPEEDVDIIVGEQVGKMKKETINDYFNNEIEYDDVKRLEILSKSTAGLELKDIADKGTNEQKEALATLVDIPEGDVASREAAFSKLGITDKAKKQEYIEALNQYRKDIVADRFKEELKSQGLQTKYFTGKRQQTSPSRSSSSDSDIAFNRYAEEKGLETTKTINNAINIISDKQRRDAGRTPSMKQMKEVFIDDFEIDKIKVGGSVKEVRNVELNKNGKISFIYDKAMIKGQPVQDAVTYDIYNPASMRDFYSATSVQAPSGTKSMKLYSDLYDKEMSQHYTSEQGLAELDNANMDKWFDFVFTKGNDKQRELLLRHKFNDPTIARKQSIKEAMTNKAKKNK